MDGARDMPLVPLVLFADVDPGCALDRLRLARVDFDDAILDLLEKFPVAHHCFKNDSSRPRHSRIALRTRRAISALTFRRRVAPRFRLYLTVAAAAIVAAGLVVGLTLDTRTTPTQPKAAPGKPPVPRLTGAVGTEIVAAFRDWPHGSIDTMQRLGLEHDGGKTAAERSLSAIVQYYRGVGSALGRVPGRRGDRARVGEEARAQHDHPQPRRQSPPPELLRGILGRPGLPGVRPRQLRSAAQERLAGAGGRASGLGRVALSAGGEAPSGERRREGRGRRRALRRGQPDAVVLASRPADGAVPEEPGRPLLPRAAPRLDEPGAEGDRAVPASRRRSGRRRRSERRPRSS